MPSDEELRRMTGVSSATVVAGMDRESFEAWVAVGFTHEEAFQLLIAHKRGTIYAEIDVTIKEQ